MDEKRMDRLEEQVGALREDVGSLKKEVGAFKEATARRFDEVREEIRLQKVVQEGLRSEIQLVAEGVANVSEGLEKTRTEVREGFEEIRKMIKPLYGLLGPQYRDLDRRVEVLEERELEDREFLQGLRKRFGTR